MTETGKRVVASRVWLTQAPLASVIAPLLGAFLSMTLGNDQEMKLAVGIGGSALILIGFASSIAGFFAYRRSRKASALVLSSLGLIISLFFIIGAVSIFQMTAKIKENRSRPFSIKVPEGYSNYPQGKASEVVLYSYVKGDPSDGNPHLVMQLTSLGGWISPSRDDEAISGMRKAKPEASLVPAKWRDYKIVAFRIPVEMNGIALVTYCAQIPLIPNACQVNVCGIKEKEDEVKADFAKALKGIDGPTNWR